MNKYISNGITGIFIGVGIAVVLTIWVQFEEYRRSSKLENKEPEYENIDTSSVKIEGSRLITFGHTPTIRVVATNLTDQLLETVRIHVDLFDSVSMFGNCWENFKSFKPNESREVIVDCHTFRTDNFPSEVRINPRVDLVSVIK